MKPQRRKATRKDEVLKKSLVPPIVAALLSAIVPGLGQALARKVRRGLVIFVSFITIVPLLFWRYKLAAPRDTGWSAIIQKAFYLEPFLLWLTIAVAILYLWIIYDAFRVAQLSDKQQTMPFGVFAMLLIVFFAIGWQIGQIDLGAMISQLDDAGPALSRVLWPWDRAITYPEELNVGEAVIESPCGEEPFIQPEPPEEGPYLVTDLTCGETSEQGLENGTLFHVNGYRFEPGVEAEIWWKDAIGNEFRQRQGGEYIKVTPDENGEFELDIIMPYRLLPSGAARGGPLEWTLQARQLAAMGDWEFSAELKIAIEKMIETIFIGMMATFFGIILALPLSFLAARNLMSANPLTLAVYYIVRTIMNIVRSIEPLIWAIVFIIVVGLGPFAGILALTLHSAAALGKLYSESIESIDPGPIEAVQATGANWLQTVMYAVVPQVIPPFVSFTIYRWDVNIRMSTIIGMVGGGGIGFLLTQWIRLLDYKAAGIAVWFIAITVAILDYVSAEIRERFI